MSKGARYGKWFDIMGMGESVDAICENDESIGERNGIVGEKKRIEWQNDHYLIKGGNNG